MALAILELLDFDEANARFLVDTGTNSEFELRFGRSTRTDDDGDAIDEQFYRTPPRHGSGDLLAPAAEVVVPVSRLAGGKCYAQLFTSKPGGRSAAVSEVVQVPVGASPFPRRNTRDIESRSSMMSTVDELSHNPPRIVPHEMVPLSRPAGLEDILGQIVKVAAPAVVKLISSPPKAGDNASVAPAKEGGALDMIGQVLQAILGALGTPGSQAKSLSMSGGGNRFNGDDSRLAAPMVFGIDDAIIGAAVGQFVQILPQLMNSANQKRVDMKKADNTLIGGILSDVNKRMMMDKLADAQKAAAAQGPASQVDPEQIAKLLEMLKQAPVAQQSSLPMAVAAQGSPKPGNVSARAVLDFALEPSTEWNGARKAVFDRTRGIRLSPRLVIAPPVPNAPLAKAILKIVLQDAGNPDVRIEKIFKLKNVAANAPLDCAFDAAELSRLPPGTCCSVIGELRWQTKQPGGTRALGSAELVLVGPHFVKSRGAAVSGEQELADMSRFRPFWNRVWEAPNLNASGHDPDRRKFAWDLDMTMRYSVLVSGSHEDNAFMKTRVLGERDDPDSPTAVLRGKLKGGVELSTAELNKLRTLWDGRPPLEPAKVSALSARSFVESSGGEFKHHIRLRGRAGQAGMVWVMPVLKLFAVTLSSVAAADDSGRVTATREEDIQFPLPVAARVIGLKAS